MTITAGDRLIHNTNAMDWQPSPSPTVWRKRLHLLGDTEKGQVTSVVRYDPNSAFPTHEHPAGEEILVLDGVFSDEYGDYPAGSYLLNPPGFAHAPFSRSGCVIFVKLRQYGGPGRLQCSIDTQTAAWQTGDRPGISFISLYAQAGYPERMQLVRWQPGVRETLPPHSEIFIIEGEMGDRTLTHPARTWIRHGETCSMEYMTEAGCVFYLAQ